jgi:hypothetical protein
MIDKQKNDSEYFVIFASDLDNTETLYRLRNRHIGFKQLEGQYKGVKEDSYITNIDNLDKIKDLIQKQESILLLGKCKDDNTRRAMLVFTNGGTQDIGAFTAVNKKEAEKADGYTKDGQQYYICK